MSLIELPLNKLPTIISLYGFKWAMQLGMRLIAALKKSLYNDFAPLCLHSNLYIK